MRIPQAIFTSFRGEQFAGYQLGARSEEIGEDLARALNTWGPAHDSLLDETADEPSINFHPLGSEQYCLSLTSCAGAEYSGRVGARIYTQMFVLPLEGLARFDNNPFLILRALEVAGRTAVPDELPQSLPSLPLVGRAGEADLRSLELVLEQLSPDSLANLTTTIFENSAVGVGTFLSLRTLFSALFQIISRDERLSVSFTTGLRYSPCRPFRIFPLPDAPVARRQFLRQPDVAVVELPRRDPSPTGSRMAQAGEWIPAAR